MFKTQYDNEAKLWRGRDQLPLYNPKISLAQVILKSCINFGPKIAQVSADSGIKLSNDEIRIKMIRAAQNLQKRGYNSKEVFAVLAKNSHHLAPIVFASLAIGSAVNTLDLQFSKTELLHMLKTTKPALIFCDVEAYDLTKQCLVDLDNSAKIFTFGGSKGDSEPVECLFTETHNESDFVPVKVDGENESAAIVCSSGTTGLSKGVCLSHAALLDGFAHFDAFTSNDVLLSFSSLYWVTGWYMLLAGTIQGANRIITTETYDPEMHLRLIEQYKVTFGLNSPTHLTLLSKSDHLDQTDLSSLRFLIVAGGKCSFQVQNRINSRLPNVGQIVSFCSIKIIDDNGNRCGVGEDGEICFKTNYKFIGYYGNQKATDESADNEGFFLTADIGHFDEDGNLYIVDRKKDFIKYCNLQISPSQIESYLVESPKIEAACIVGLPEEVAGELPTAFIVRGNKLNISEKEVYDMVAGHFADYCKLRGGVHFVDSLPMTPSGKILRRKVRDSASQFT
ncbi:probable 4-coumarate--CoA ligase 1, partial [Sitodiplosis mosellana]|uniref:probable 4-coumarate--CoA ligase 1 n=1 Tax=Sitodiplosis mosellana TaxID=263140 RepID=UPI0024452094